VHLFFTIICLFGSSTFLSTIIGHTKKSSQWRGRKWPQSWGNRISRSLFVTIIRFFFISTRHPQKSSKRRGRKWPQLQGCPISAFFLGLSYELQGCPMSASLLIVGKRCTHRTDCEKKIFFSFFHNLSYECISKKHS